MAEQLMTAALCQEVIETYVDGAFKSLRANGTFGRDEGSLIVARTLCDVPEMSADDYFSETHASTGPDADFYRDFVVYEHTWGGEGTGVLTTVDGSPTFSAKALQKVFGSIIHEADYDVVLAERAHDVARRGLIAFPGAILRDVRPMTGDHPALPVVIGYSGLWWYHDTMIAELTAAGLRAELTKRAVHGQA